MVDLLLYHVFELKYIIHNINLTKRFVKNGYIKSVIFIISDKPNSFDTNDCKCVVTIVITYCKFSMVK